MATGTRMQQSQRALEEQLGTIQETLKQQDAGAIQRHERLWTEIATQANNLQEQSYPEGLLRGAEAADTWTDSYPV